jgi:hypothetical protein
MTTLARFCLSALLAIALLGQSKADSRYDVIRTPAWVVPAELTVKKSADLETHKGGAEYLLVDHQIRLDAIESDYARFVTRLTNISGIEAHSQITISFDPKVERLHLHSVFIRRGSLLIDQLRNGRVRVIQRENNLEDQLVDGELTFHLVMADVRVGDTVDYSYTLERRNLEWGSRNFGRFQTQWSDQVGFLRIRILTPVGSILKTLSHPEETPKIWVASGLSIVEWSKLNVAPFRHENDAPSWFQQYSVIEYSQFSSWGQIVEAALPLYRVSAAPSTELRDLAKRLATTGSTDADRAVATMKFVQDEIRYTGIEEGEGAFRPTPPNEVLARRYGDCKDKTLLAVTLLKALGIEAAPALVSTRWKREVRNHLPSPGLMNHVVVRAVIAGKTYWFDATATGQGGQLANFTQASFGEALVISPGIADLEQMAAAESSQPLIRSQAIFDLRAGLFAESSLNVTTTYFDAEADTMRRKLRSRGAAELRQKYLHYYKGQYPDARSGGPLQIEDDLEKNELTVAESYRIKDVFETDKEGNQKLYVNADTVTDALKAPDLPERTTPLAVDFPNYLSERVQLLLPVAWNVDADVERFDTEFFRYNSKVGYRDKQITLDYEFKALQDHVPAAQLPAYIKQLERARDDTYFHISRNPGATTSAAPTDSFLLLKLLALFAGLFLVVRLSRSILTVRALLASTLQRVQVSACSDEEIPENERMLLKSLDDEFIKSQFEPIGFLSHLSLYTRYDKPEYLRVLGCRDLPIAAFVARQFMPEYGSYVRFWLETRIPGGPTLQTTDGWSDSSIGAPEVLSEAIPGASPAELLKRHTERLKALDRKDLGAAGKPLSGFAELIAADFARIRATWSRKAWIHATTDADLDRLTLKGAVRLARASIRIYGAKASGQALIKASMAASSSDHADRAAADYLAAWHVSKEPRGAPGHYRSLIVYCSTWALVLLGVLAAVSGAFVSIAILAAVLIHEAAHGWALRKTRSPTGSLFFLPFTGLINSESGDDIALTGRVSVMLAGPIVGLLFAIMLLTGDLFWPNHYLRDAAWVFIVFNGLLLIPFSLTDGSRILAAVTSPGSAWRPIAQWISVVAVLAVGIYLHSAVLNSAGFVWAVWCLAQVSMFRLTRKIVSQIPKESSWESALRAALIAMTGPNYNRWSASIRQMHAITIATEFTRQTASRRERVLSIVAYVSCAVLAICAALVTRV